LKSAGDLPICNRKTRHASHVQERHITSRARRIPPTAPAREGTGHQFQTQMIAAAQARSLHRLAALLAPQNLCTINSFLMGC
jgi:hypothetical protein